MAKNTAELYKVIRVNQNNKVVTSTAEQQAETHYKAGDNSPELDS